jgi:hypothetical protein
LIRSRGDKAPMDRKHTSTPGLVRTEGTLG